MIRQKILVLLTQKSILKLLRIFQKIRLFSQKISAVFDALCETFQKLEVCCHLLHKGTTETKILNIASPRSRTMACASLKHLIRFDWTCQESNKRSQEKNHYTKNYFASCTQKTSIRIVEFIEILQKKVSRKPGEEIFCQLDRGNKLGIEFCWRNFAKIVGFYLNIHIQQKVFEILSSFNALKACLGWQLCSYFKSN